MYSTNKPLSFFDKKYFYKHPQKLCVAFIDKAK